MPKYKLTIVEIIKTDGGNPPYDEMQKNVYEQVIEGLDVAKVVIAANEGHERATAAAAAR